VLADDLEHAAICEWNGIIYAAGWSGEAVWFEYSEDGGRSKAPVGGGDRVQVCPAGEQQPAIAALVTGEIVAAVDRDGQVATYVSRDQGESWAQV
jgi:hypothetical protein